MMSGSSTVSLEVLKNIKGKLGADKKETHRPSGQIAQTKLDIDRYLSHYGIGYRIKSTSAGEVFSLDRCPFDTSHGKNEASIIRQTDGKIIFQCFHSSCQGHTWKEARKLISGDNSLAPFLDSPRMYQAKTRPTVSVQGDEWPDPIPLDRYSELPDFPVEILPVPGRAMVEVAAEVNQIDPGLPGVFYLAALATALSKKAEVDLISHREPLNLYLASVLPSGEHKSSTVGLMSKPLYDFQTWQQKKMTEEVTEKENQRRIEDATLARLQKTAAQSENEEDRTRMVKESEILAQRIQANPVPKLPVFLSDDVTPEALGGLMAENQERLAILSAEGGIFGIMGGRYNERGGANLDLFLKAHSCDPWAVHRVGRAAKSMSAPALTLGLAVQPDVIEEIGGNRQFHGRGLLARFLFHLGRPRAGFRIRTGDVKVIPEGILKQYKTHILSLCEIPLDFRLLTLSVEALKTWNDFHNDIELELRPSGKLYELQAWGSKLPGAVARIAGLLKFAVDGSAAANTPLTPDIINRACILGSYFLEHALAAFDLMRVDPAFEVARKILDFLIKHQPKNFKARDVFRHTSYKKMDEITPGINILLERDFIRVAPSGYSGMGRPGAQVYAVNPKVNKRGINEAPRQIPEAISFS